MDERLQFVARRLVGEPMAELCREFGISRKTGYKIFDRYQLRKAHPSVRRSVIASPTAKTGGPSFVAVVQPADLWQRHHSPHVLRLDRSRFGRVLP